MLFSSLLVVPVIPGHATGQVNINGGTEVVVPQLQKTVSVPINIAGSDALNGFDVQVVADPTVLSGASVSLTGTVLPSPTVVIECLNGVLVAGTTCAPQDGKGVVHLGALHIGSLVAAPVSGLLFTITYNIVGTSAGTPISFNPGCTGTSVSGGDCVTVSNGTPTAVPETDLGASFANLNDFSMTPAFTKLSTPPGTSIMDTISFAALGAFSDSLTVTTTGPCSLSSGTVDLTFPTGTDTLTCSSTTALHTTATVTAAGFASGVTHSKSIDVLVAAAGFSSTLNHASVAVPRGTSDSTTIVTLTGVSSFSGTVAITATCPAGITGSGSPAMVTLTPDASGYSSGASTLTVSVGSTVATGSYPCAIVGGPTLTVLVQPLDFSIAAIPASESIPRGSTAAATLSFASLGSFAGTIALNATITVNSIDAGSGATDNIGPGFLPSTITLTAGGSGSTAFFASTVKIGTSPNPANTATGSYTATINATSGSLSHSVTITFLVQDFDLGPNFCAGPKLVFTSPNGFFDPVSIGESCNSFTLTTQTTRQGGGQSTLWMQVNSLGGLETHGVDGTGVVAAVNPTGPGRGTRVPYLHRNVCFFDVFLPNGTKLTRNYLKANGPIVRAGPFSGCRFSFAYALPNDVEATTCVKPDVPSNLDCAVPNNVDFLAITADALPTTLTGTYLVNVCGLLGALLNCQMVTLIVVKAPVFTGVVWTHGNSISQSLGGHFKATLTNVDPTNSLFAQVTISGAGSTGDSFTVTASAKPLIAPGGSSPFNIDVSFTTSEIGETFTVNLSATVSPVDAGAIAVDPVNGTTSGGTSTLQSFSATFTVGP